MQASGGGLQVASTGRRPEVRTRRATNLVEAEDVIGGIDQVFVMGRDENGSPALSKASDQGNDVVGGPPIEVGRGLIHDQHGRVGEQRSSDADATLLAAGELSRKVCRSILPQPDRLH